MKIYKTVCLLALFSLNLSTIEAQTTLVPPRDLKATFDILEPTVGLSWWAFGLPYWLHYDNGYAYQTIGSDNAGEFDVAIKYDAQQLSSFHGMGINSFAFYASDSNTTYKFRLWMGVDADSLVYEQEITEVNVEKWNTISIDSTMVIDSTQTYYFGYNCTFNVKAYPITIDQGPVAKQGYSDLIKWGDKKFESLKTLNNNIDGNLNFRVYLTPPAAPAKAMVLSKQNTKLQPFEPQWAKRLIQENQKFSDAERNTAPSLFYIYRNNEKIGESNTTYFTDVLTESGEYAYQVSAIYTEGESERSDSVLVGYDTNRIPKNAVIIESFINSGAYGGTDNSPSSYGVATGLYELENEVEVNTMIMYHSATAVLGPDPFANQASEDRFMKYFILTGGFPATYFNGNMFLGGGSSTQSLYEVYRNIYEQALEVLTPFKASGNVSVKSSGIYKFDFDAEKVGIYLNDHLKLHIVVTQTNIDYVWSNNRIEQVYHVQTQMPFGAQGKPIDLSNTNIIHESIDISISPLLDITDFHVVAFIQDDETNEILNGVHLDFPYKKPVVFQVLTDVLPLANANVEVNGTIKTTDDSGFVKFLLYDYLTGVEAIVSKTGYADQKVTFDVATTDTLTVDLISTGLTDQSGFEARIYPNPANADFEIMCAESAELQILNAQGQFVLQQSIQAGTTKINISGLKAGVYIVKLAGNGKTHIQKILKY